MAHSPTLGPAASACDMRRGGVGGIRQHEPEAIGAGSVLPVAMRALCRCDTRGASPIAVGESRLDLAQDVIGLGDDVIIDLRHGDTARRLHRPELRQ